MPKKDDRLGQVHLFADHKSRILLQPKRGERLLDWTVGVHKWGHLLRHTWDSDYGIPHMLVAGAPQSGVSNLLTSMLCQLIHNNHPDDLDVWLAVSEANLQRFVDAPHVKKSVSLLTGEPPVAALATMLTEAVGVMHERHKAYSAHPLAPQRLSEARSLAATDPSNSAHLDLPTVIIVIDECANYFAPPASADAKAHQEVIQCVETLARQGRAVGVRLAVATHFPSRKLVPFSLLLQSERIGFRVPSAEASVLLTDRPGLEAYSLPGHGMMTLDTNIEEFRSLLLASPAHNGSDTDESQHIIDTVVARWSG